MTVIAGAGLFIQDRFFTLESHRAVLSAAPITLRAPLDGVIELPGVPPPGQVVDATPGFALIRNPRADNGRQADLRAELAMLEGDAEAIRRRLAALRPEAEAAAAAAAAFQTARLEQLAARRAETAANEAAAR
ncbi:MAG: hypothetical protein K2X11_03455, partial [Acetobacteraceae bacterium]|nr:hypothetical protein [Acetobacteraceae bacterium]